MSDLRTFTLEARELLTRETTNLLREVYGLQEDATFLSPSDVPPLQRLEGAAATRARLEQLFADEAEAGVSATEAYRKLVKEVAFTHLNRLVAFKMMEARRLVRETISRLHDSNGFKLYVVDHPDDLALYEQGTSPADDGGEGPRNRAYRHFLLWQCEQLAQEIRVLFDAENLASQIFPRPRVLKELLDRLNADDLKEFWTEGNEETIGWVYQYFIAEEKAAAFNRVFKQKKKFRKEDVPAATQVFTPRWIVKFLVHNSLGRMWIEMHPESRLADQLDSIIPDAASSMRRLVKLAKEIRVLDPAMGTMHFGLVAFDLLFSMYSEEIDKAGQPGWPERPSVASLDDIPAAIIANNLFGVDIDLRATQLAAFALYLRAKSINPRCSIDDSRLACADVTIFRGGHLHRVADEMALPKDITRDLLSAFCESINLASEMGSLVRLEKHFRNFKAEELRVAIDRYAQKKSLEGQDESYFAGEVTKGLRLLDVMDRRYDVVFSNPPYMSNRNMYPLMSDYLRRNFKRSKGDLYAAFIERCGELVSDEGLVAMVTQHSFMYVSSYEELRELLRKHFAIGPLAHLGPRAFPEVTGEKVSTTAFVIRRQGLRPASGNASGTYLRLVKEPDAAAKQRAFEEALAHLRAGQPDSRVFTYCQQDFSTIPGSPWVYSITPGLRRLFVDLQSLGTLARPKHGMSTGDNVRFLRRWWEVGSENIGRGLSPEASKVCQFQWCPYMKGGSFRRWYGNQEFLVNFQSCGRELLASKVDGTAPGHRHDNPDYYFRRGVTWTDLTTGRFSARLSPGGFIFDVSGSSVFPPDVELVLAVMNSSWAQYALKLLNPTVHVQVGDLARLPIPRHSSSRLHTMVEEAVRLARAESEEDETTYDFIAPPDWAGGASLVMTRRQRLAAVEGEVDDEVFRLYGISEEDRRVIEGELSGPTAAVAEGEETGEFDEGEDEEESGSANAESGIAREELARRWISYAVGIALGRFQPGVDGGLGRGSFSAETTAGLRSLVDDDGLMPVAEGHPEDLALRVLRILKIICGEVAAEDLVQLAAGNGGTLRDSLERYLLGPFFKDHVKRYRKRPVYWLLQSPDRTFSAYLFHECASADTLAVLQGVRYLGGQIRRFEAEHQEAQQRERSATGRERNGWSRRARDLADALDDLRQMDRAIHAINNHPVKDRDGRPAVVRWEPELDDGVLLNAAPLHALMPAWKRADTKLDLKKAWAELERGVYDWSHTAMRYWPQRVLKACEENESFAIAHGLR